MNNNLKSRLRARKYRKCMKTWHEASTSGELKRNSKVVCWTSGSESALKLQFLGRKNVGGGGHFDTPWPLNLRTKHRVEFSQCHVQSFFSHLVFFKKQHD